MTSTLLDTSTLPATRPQIVQRAGIVYVPAGGLILKFDGRGRRIGTITLPGDVSGIALDGWGALYATGSLPSSRSGFGPGTTRTYGKGGGGGGGDAYVVKESSAGKLVWSTGIGGTNMDYGSAIAVDASGEVWLAGSTTSDDFPVRHAFQGHYHGPSVSHLPPRGAAFPEDAWIAKFDARGQFVFGSYLGGSQNEEVNSIDITATGEPLFFGWTGSPNFPFSRRMLAPPASPARVSASVAFVTRLTRQGGAISITPIAHGGFTGNGIAALDETGAMYVLLGNEVFKLNPSASRILYRTGLGQYAGGSGLALGPRHTVYVTGAIVTPGLRVASSMQARMHRRSCGSGESLHNCADAFVSAINSRGRLVFGTYLGGTRDDGGEAIAVDRKGTAYVLGSTDSNDFPLRNAAVCAITTSSGDSGPAAAFLIVIKR